MYILNNLVSCPIHSEKSVISFDVGIKNLSYCILERHEQSTKENPIYNISYWEIIALNLPDKPSVSDIGIQLYKELKSRQHLLAPSYIVIENQPVLKNPRMKTIQIMLLSYFLMNDKTNITLLNSSIKLKAYSGPEVVINNIKSEYTIRKKKVIAYVKYMIQHSDSQYKAFLENCKKKDDLADSFLQGVYILNKCV